MIENTVVKIFDNNNPIDLPDNLGEYRDVTINDRDRREIKVKIVSIMLNHYLGWYETISEYESSLNNASEQIQIEEINSLAPIRWSEGFRLSPGEAKRIARRLPYLPLLHNNISRGYWNAHTKKSNKQLLSNLENKRSPSVIINKYKTVNSRNNYYTEKNLKVNWIMFDKENDIWNSIVSNWIADNSRPSYTGSATRFSHIRNLRMFIVKVGSNFSQEDNNNENNREPRFRNMTPQALVSNLFIYFKECLTIRRNTPEILYNEGDDFVELRRFLIEQNNKIERANRVLSNIGQIEKIILSKSYGLLKYYVKIKLNEPKIAITHSSGEARYETYYRNIQTTDGNNSNYYQVAIFNLNYIATNGGTFNTQLTHNIGYTDINNADPGLYVTANRNSTQANWINNLFNDLNISQSQLNSNVCLGDHGSIIKSSLKKLDWLTSVYSIHNWYTVYTPGRTQPYRHPRQVFFGVDYNMPNWYQSQHDSTAANCQSLFATNVVFRNNPREHTTDIRESFNSVTLATFKRIESEDLFDLATNHCFKCWHKSSCDGAKYALKYGTSSTGIKAKDRFEQKVNNLLNPVKKAKIIGTEIIEASLNHEETTSDEITTGPSEAVMNEMVQQGMLAAETDNDPRPLHRRVLESEEFREQSEITCEHGLSGPSDCIDCDGNIRARLTSEAAEEPEVNQGEAVAEEAIERERVMNLMNAWAQAER